jgi:hypothetical protein
MAGLSEVAPVSGRGSICGGCLVARYCGTACQRQHWKQHKPVCQAIKAVGVHSGSRCMVAPAPSCRGNRHLIQVNGSWVEKCEQEHLACWATAASLVQKLFWPLAPLEVPRGASM